jgi:hypothetical protein
MEAQADLFTALLARAQDLKKGDDAAVKALIAEMLAVPLSDERSDMLVRAAARASRFALAAVRSLVAAERLRREQEARATPEAQEAARASAAAAEEAEKIVRDAEGERLWQSCQDLARSPNLMNRMEAIAHRLGVVGERMAICGTYLAMTSRLLRDNAISLLRRGAPAGGKNHLLGVLSRLMPKDSVISISSASPMALIYHGEDEDALAHKIIVVAEVAAILQTNNGDEHPMAAWIPERSATCLREADLNVLSKFGNQGLEWRLEPEAFTRREVRREDDLLDILVGCPIDIQVAWQPST